MTAHEAGFSVTTDAVIFGLVDGRLSVLLRLEPRTGRWRLPTAIPQPQEDLDASAARAVRVVARLDRVYSEQLHTVAVPGTPDRPRRVSVAYLCLMGADRVREAEIQGSWFALTALPSMVPDCPQTILRARQRLTDKLSYSTIGFQLMPRTFTLTELQETFEQLLCEPLDKRNFRKRVQGLGELEETGQRRQSQSHRPARLFRLKRPERVAIIR
jgi:8-oxo-dGTP diphosphatase